MATDKKFSVAGVSTINGKTKIRWANDVMRIKILQKNGHSDLELITLPNEMTKAEIAAYLIKEGFGKGNAATESAIAYVQKKNPAAVTKVPATAASEVPA